MVVMGVQFRKSRFPMNILQIERSHRGHSKRLKIGNRRIKVQVVNTWDEGGYSVYKDDVKRTKWDVASCVPEPKLHTA